MSVSTSSCLSSDWSNSTDQVNIYEIQQYTRLMKNAKPKIERFLFCFYQRMKQAPEWSRKPNNTTVIRINENMKPGYPCHPAYRQNQNTPGLTGLDNEEEPLYDPVAPRDYESHDFDANPRDARNCRTCYVRDNASIIYDCPPPIDERNAAYNLPKAS